MIPTITIQDQHGFEPIPEKDVLDIDESAVPLTRDGQDKDKSFIKTRESRFSTASRFSVTSRPSFSGLVLASRASVASLKSTITKVNSELYPERGSFVASRLSQSFAQMPRVAEKLYIITQVLAAISVSMGSMAVGYTGGYTGTALSSIQAEYNASLEQQENLDDGSQRMNETSNESKTVLFLSPFEESWVVSLMPFSAMAGSMMGGYLVDALGRKMVILICGPPFLAGWLIIGSAYNVWMLYVGRILCGLCVGLLTLSLPVYLGETIQAEIRGTLGLLPTTFGNFGILLCFIFGAKVNWAWLAYIGAVIPAIFFAMMIFVPETPRWYVSKGKSDHAEKSLQWLRGSDNDVEFELEAIEANYTKSLEEASSFKDLLSRRYMKPFGLCIILMILQQMSGINAVMSYTKKIFQSAGSSIDENLCTIIVGTVNLGSTFVANALIDRLGRKILLYLSDGMMIVSLIALGVYFTLKDSAYTNIQSISWLPLVSMMVYVVAFSLGFGPIPWLFMGEALPAKIRGKAASIVTAFNWIFSFIVTKTFPDLEGAIGKGGVFFLYCACMVVGLFFCVLCVPETKGKSLEQIEEELCGDLPSPRQRRTSEMSGIYIK